MTSVVTLNHEIIEGLAHRNVAAYRAKLAHAGAGHAGYRLEEIRYYLGLWESIIAKGYDWPRLTQQEREEIADAYDDERGVY